MHRDKSRPEGDRAAQTLLKVIDRDPETIRLAAAAGS
jgi:hypothetical protein